MSPQQYIGGGSEPAPASSTTSQRISALVSAARGASTTSPASQHRNAAIVNDSAAASESASVPGPSAVKPARVQAPPGSANSTRRASSGQSRGRGKGKSAASPRAKATSATSSPAKKGKKKSGPKVNTESAPESTPSESPQAAPASSGSARVPWDGDAGGPGQQTSLDVLLEWLSEPDNFARLKGKDGSTRASCCSEISRLISSAGTKCARTADSVSDKITRVIAQFNELDRWLGETGQGLLDAAAAEEDPVSATAKAEANIQSWMNKTCPFYETLLPVLVDRASVRPRISFGTGDEHDPAVELLSQPRPPREVQYDDFEPDEQPLCGWQESDSEQRDTDANLSGTATTETALFTPAPKAAKEPAAKEPEALRAAKAVNKTEIKKKPGTASGSDSGHALGSAKSTSSSKRMSSFEANFDARGDKRLRMDTKAKDFEMRTLAFKEVAQRASSLTGEGLTRGEAFAAATQEFQTFMNTMSSGLLDADADEQNGSHSKGSKASKSAPDASKKKQKQRAIDPSDDDDLIALESDDFSDDFD
ncbi:hypothetical protein V8E36_002013 [Tilletia maclaganii]